MSDKHNIWGGENNSDGAVTITNIKDEGVSGLAKTETSIITNGPVIQGGEVMKQSDGHTSTINTLFDKNGATDEDVATAFIDIAKHATKHIATKDDGAIEIPDNKLRKDTWKDIAKMKGLFDKQVSKSKEMPENLIYVFSSNKKIEN